MKKLVALMLILPFLATAQNKKIDSLKKAIMAARIDTAKIDLSYELAFEQLGMDPEGAGRTVKTAFALSQKSNYPKGIAVYYNFQSILGSLRGDFPALKQNAEKALTLATRYNIPVTRASALNSLGIYYWQTGLYSESIKRHLAALKIREQIKDEAGIAKSLGNLGQVYMDNSKYHEAHQYTVRALAMGKKLHNSYIQIACLHLLANVASAQKKYVQALNYDAEALPLCLAGNNKRGLAQIYSNMAHCYVATHELDKALKYQMQVLELDLFFNDKKQVSDTYLNIGEIYKEKGQPAEAINWLKKALVLTKETQYRKGTKDVWQMLSVVYEKQGDYKNALTAHQKFQKAAEDLVNETNGKEIAVLQTQYETQKKEQQIKLLNKENTIQKLSLSRKNLTITFIIGFSVFVGIVGVLYYNRAKLKQAALLQQERIVQQENLTKAIISAEEKERSRIAGDLHDGVGQLFSAVKMNLSGLLDRVVIQREQDRFLAEKTIALVDESCKEVRAISHQMMPNMLLRTGLASDVKSFIEKIDPQRLKVQVETSGFTDKLESNVEVVLYRVIQESVNNVIKHANATTLDIRLIRDAEGISATIADNGVGFNTANVDAFEGIGLKNIVTRITYLKGTIKYLSEPGDGTIVKIWVPVV